MTSQNLVHNEKIKVAERLAEAQKIDYEAKLAEKDAIIAGLNDTIGRVQLAANRAAAAVDTDTIEACRRRVKKYTKLLSDGATVAGRCSAELRGKDTALKACVKAYEELEIVYNKHK